MFQVVINYVFEKYRFVSFLEKFVFLLKIMQYQKRIPLFKVAQHIFPLG